MKLVKFVCVAKAHANGQSAASLTIHAGVWAFCSTGGNAPSHDWSATDGLPIMDAMHFPLREPEPVQVAPALEPTSSPGRPAPERHVRAQ